MNWDEQKFDKGHDPIAGAKQRSGLLATCTARLTHQPDMHLLTTEGLSGWSALTAIAAVLESPKLEVLLGLETGTQVAPMHSSDIDPANVPLRYAVCVEGPIEDADAKVLERALLARTSLREADFRTVASVLSRAGEVEVQATNERALLAVVAEMIRRYLATQMKCDISLLSLPDAGLIDNLLACTGRLAIRPIETDIYAEFVDIGLVLPDSDDLGPATTSVVYDLTTRTWHAE